MANVSIVQLPDGSTHNVKDNTSGYATTAYVDSEIGSLTKSSIGLGNVDNTSDANKPVSTAQQAALDAKANNSLVAYVESSTTATKRYEIGNHFILNGVRYKATAIIANGGTITVGTNCVVADTVSEEVENGRSYYGTCSTAAATQNKVVSVSDSQNFKLFPGCVVGVKFTNTNSYSATASNPVTLNVNGTGAKSILYNTSLPTGTNTAAFGKASTYIYYMYDGTYWVWCGSSLDNNTTYSTMSASELTTGTATSARTVRADYLKSGINTLIDNKIGAITFVLKNKTLTFSNLVATVSDSRVTADTYAMVFFNDATLQAAANAGVVVDTSSGTITFTATTAPSSNLVCDIVCRKG